MKLIIEYQPWLSEPYRVYLQPDGDEISRAGPALLGEYTRNALHPLMSFETEEQARMWCELRRSGKTIAEYKI